MIIFILLLLFEVILFEILLFFASYFFSRLIANLEKKKYMLTEWYTEKIKKWKFKGFEPLFDSHFTTISTAYFSDRPFTFGRKICKNWQTGAKADASVSWKTRNRDAPSINGVVLLWQRCIKSALRVRVKIRIHTFPSFQGAKTGSLIRAIID